MSTLSPTALALLALACYLIGSIPWAYLVGRWLGRVDIRTVGTGNIGAMNIHRATGSKALAVAVAFLDGCKGAGAVLLAIQVAESTGGSLLWAQGVAATAAVLGHNYPFPLGFRGGKGLSTAAGALLLMQPWMLLLWGVAFFATVGLSRYFILGQVVATALMPLVAMVLVPSHLWVITVPVLPIIARHLPRLRGLLQGTEPRMYYKLRR